MKNLLIATVAVAGIFASVGQASAIDNVNLEKSNWALETFKTGIR